MSDESVGDAVACDAAAAARVADGFAEPEALDLSTARRLDFAYVTADDGSGAAKAAAALESVGVRAELVWMEENSELIHTKDAKHLASLLPVVLDWYLIGEFPYVASCSTTYALTAVGRRRFPPAAVFVHQHHGDHEDVNFMGATATLVLAYNASTGG